MGSALLNTTIADPTLAEPAENPAAPSSSDRTAQALRHQVAERLAAHRNRRGGTPTAAAPRPQSPPAANPRAARIAATVAERYAHSQSYRAFLAAEAERAVQQARAAAEIAALNAQAVARAQQQLLDTLHQAASDEAHAASTSANPEPQPSPTLARGPGALPNPGLPHASAVQPVADPPQPAARERSLWPELDIEATPAPRHQRAHRTESHPTPSTPDLGSAFHARERVEDGTKCTQTSNLPSLTVRLYEDAATAAHVDLAARPRTATGLHSNRNQEWNEAEAEALDEEIAFRQAPVFEEPAGPPVPLPANLIEFPRQLVASRKARPRLAEGPLREETAVPTPGDGQLRIFEVDPAQISTLPDSAEPAAEAAAPQWTSIWLDAPTEQDFAPLSGNDTDAFALPATWADGQPQPNTVANGRAVPFPGAATIGRRTLAAAVNAAILFAGLLAFAATFVAIAGHWQPGTPIAVALARTGLPLNQVPAAAAITLALFYLIYQALFFSLSDATPGMRAARIALCTFDDENPSRPAIRRRTLAVLLSAIPFGLGLLWAALDEDRLTWHDRIARIYQRSY